MTGKFSIKSLCVCATDGRTKKENNASVHKDIIFELNFKSGLFYCFCNALELLVDEVDQVFFMVSVFYI